MIFKQAYSLWQGWLEDNLKVTTSQPMLSRYERHLRRSICNKDLNDLTEPMVRAMIQGWRRKKLGYPSIRQNVNVINSIYTCMRELGLWTGPSPISGMSIRESASRRERTLTKGQCLALLNEFRKTRENYYWLAIFCWRGGMRPSEVIRIRPMDINQDEHYINILDVKNPKGIKKTRRVYYGSAPMLKTAVQWVLEFSANERDHVFPKSIDCRYVRKVLAKLGHNVGVSGRDRTNRVSLYTLRHSYATQALNFGANVKDVQSMLGHDTIESTMHYMHAIKDAAKHGQAILDAGLDRQPITEKLELLQGGK
jgi:site-specific recombinase XerD